MKIHRLLARTLLILSVTLFLPRLAGATGTDIWTGGGGSSNIVWLSAANWKAGTVPQVGDQLVFTNTVSLVTSNNYPAGTIFSGITYQTPAGAFVLRGNGVTLTNNITDLQVVTPESVNLPVMVNTPYTPLSVGVVPNGILYLNGGVSGSGGVTTVDGGKIYLNASNGFTGTLTIGGGGTVVITNDFSLGATNTSPTAGRLVINNGTLQALASAAINTNRGIAVGPTGGNGQGAISVSDQALTPNQYTALRYGGVIANNGPGLCGLSKLGFGNLILSGANTYTGTTSNEVGTLTLDFAATDGAPLNDIINSSSPLVLGGASTGAGVTNYAQLVVSNAASTVNSQTFNGTHVTIGNAVIRTAPATATSGTINLALGALDHDAGGTLNLLPPTIFGGLGNITTTTPNNNGILGGWATIGSGSINVGLTRATNWACNDGSGNIVNYTGYTVYSSAITYMSASMAPANNIYVTGITGLYTNDVDGATTTNNVNSIYFNQLASAADFEIGSNNVVRLGQYGGLFKYDTGAGNSNILGGVSYGTTIFTNSIYTNWSYNQASAGTLTAGGTTYGSPGEIVFINTSTGSGSAQNWNIDAQITDNGPGGTVTVIKAGSGYTKFRNHNSYSGGTYIMAGRLQLSATDIGSDAPDGLGTGPIFVFPGAYLFGTLPTTPVINIAGIGTVQEPDGAWRLGGGNIVTNAIVMFGDSGMGGGSPTSPAILMGPVSGNFNMYLGAEGNVGGTGSGIMLSNQCLWTGNTIIVARLGSSGNSMRLFLGEDDALPHGFGKGNLIFGVTGINAANRIAFDLNGHNQTINGLISGFAGVTNVIFNGSNSVTSTLTIGDNDASGIWGGVIENADATFAAASTGTTAITKIGGGVETFTNANTYTGVTTISNGVLQLGPVGGGVFGSIANTPNVIIDGGAFDVSQLSYAVPASQTISMSGGTWFISTASANAPVNFTNGTLEVISPNTGSVKLTAHTVNLAGAANFIQPVNIQPIPSYTNNPPLSIFPIIQYTTLNGDPATMGVSLPSAYGGYASNDTATSTIYLVLTNGPVTPFLTWIGASGGALNSSWDFFATDWTNTVKHDAENYQDGALVTFDDTGRTNVVNLTGPLLPLGVTINNSVQNYIFTGTGAINGTNGVTKLGTGRLTLDNSGGDSYSGGLTIGAGGTVQVGAYDTNGSVGAGSITVNGSLVFERTNNIVVAGTVSGSGAISQLGTNSLLALNGANSFSGTILVTNKGTLQAGNNSALGTTNTVTTIASGSSLDVNGHALAGAQIVTLGIGATNSDGTTNGAIYNSSPTAAFPAVARVTLLGDTVFGCPPSVSSVLSNRWDLRSSTTSDANGASLSTGGHAYNLTKIGINQVGIVGATVDPALGNIDVQNGILSIEAATTGLGDPSKTLTIESGADLSLYQATNQFNKKIVLYGAGLANNLGTVNNTSGNNTIVGPMVLNSSPNGGVEVTFRSAAGNPAGGSLMLSNTITVGIEEPVTTLFSKEDTNTLIVAGTVNFGNGGANINDGTFILNGINNNPASRLTENYHSLGVPTTLGGNGTNKGPVTVNDVLWPGVGGTPSTFGSGAFAMGGTPTATFSLGSVTNAGGGTNDLLNVVGDFDPEFATVYINPVGLLTTNGSYTLVTFTGSRSSTFAGTPQLVASLGTARYVFAPLDQSTAGKVLMKVTTGIGAMVWNGSDTANPGIWDVADAQNWTNLNTTASDAGNRQFKQLDTVLLDDTIINSGGTNVLSITTNNPVQPTSITVNSTTNYTIQGPGSIVGTMNLTKSGGSTLTISSANTFNGSVIVSGGTLQVTTSAALGANTTPLVITNTGIFNLNSQTLTNKTTIIVSGSGDGNGAIVNNVTPATSGAVNALQSVTLAGNTTFGGNSRWDLRTGTGVLSTGGNPFNLTKVGTNYIAFDGVTIDTNLGNIDIQGGTLSFQQATTSMGNPSSNLTVEAGATLSLYNSTTNLEIYTKQFALNGNGVTGTVTNENGTLSLNGNMTLNGNCLIGGGTTLTINGVMSGNGSLTKVAGSALVLTTNETYTGNTIVNGGTLTLPGTASISNSPNITLSGATLDVSGRANSTLTLNSAVSQTLIAANTSPTNTATVGSTISGNLTNSVGTTVALAPNATNFVILTVTTNATLLGTTAMKLDAGNATNDVLAAGGSVTYGGTLNLTNISATPLAAGQSYQLFSAASYGGGSFTLVPATPGAGLAWDTSTLAINGILKVKSSGPAAPHITGISLSGTTLSLTANNGSAGATWTLLQSTNVALPLSQWQTNTIGAFDGSGNLSTNIANTVSNHQEFYLLKQ